MPVEEMSEEPNWLVESFCFGQLLCYQNEEVCDVNAALEPRGKAAPPRDEGLQAR